MLTTIIVNAIAVVAIMALAAGLGVMIYAKTRSTDELKDMGIQFK